MIQRDSNFWWSQLYTELITQIWKGDSELEALGMQDPGSG